MNALDTAHCEGWIRTHSRSFYLASWLLPPRVRASSWALYAFCRRSDDAVDEGAQGDPARRRVAALRARLDLVYRPDGSVTDAPLPDPIDRSFAAVARAHALPRGLPEALLAGMEMDAIDTRYASLDELYLYCFRVASTVGLMMALAMDTTGPDALLRACELGVAMQLTNIARDVGEDARNGRLYLPRAWMREVGLDPDAWLRNPEFNPQVAAVVARLLRAADELYQRAEHGIVELPRDCRPAIHAARLVYAEIGREVERADLDSVSRRAVVSGRRKLVLIARALGAAAVAPARAAEDLPPLPAVRFLVEAGTAQANRTARLPRGSLYRQTVWVLELFEELQHRQRMTGRLHGSSAQGGAGDGG
jgi:phytoene synthase